MIRVMYVFFFNDTATTEIYTLSLHDALPICRGGALQRRLRAVRPAARGAGGRCAARRWRRVRGAPGAACRRPPRRAARSEEHTSELQSRQYLVCRLLLEKKKIQIKSLQSSLA